MTALRPKLQANAPRLGSEELRINSAQDVHATNCEGNAALLPTTQDTSVLANPDSAGVIRRVDAAHQPIPSSAALLCWQCDIGQNHALGDSQDKINSVIQCGALIAQRTTGPARTAPPALVTITTEVAGAVPGSALGSLQQSDRVVSFGQPANAVPHSSKPTHLHSQPESRVSKDRPRSRDNLEALLAEAAHEIRSPIAVARQLLISVQDRLKHQLGTRGEVANFVDIASGRLQQATQWAENILTWRRLFDRQPISVRKRFFPAQLKQQVTPILMELAKAKNVDLEWIGWDRSLPRLYLDADHLSRVLINLVSNAVSASHAGQSISLRVAWQTNVVQRLVIAVEDLGPGLSGDLLEFVNSSKSVLPSQIVKVNNGIGLQNAKQLIASMGGSLTARVAASGGTTMRLSLPVDDRSSLVRSWLDQQARRQTPQQPQSAELLENSRASNQARLRMFVVRLDGLTQLDDAQMSELVQRKALSNDFVYRVACDRWLWLSIDSDECLQRIQKSLSDGIDFPTCAGSEVARWLVQQTHAWAWAGASAFSDAQDERATFTAASILITLAQQVSSAMQVLIGKTVPPLDSLELHAQTFRESKLHALELLTETRVDSAVLGPRSPKTSERARRLATASVETQFRQDEPLIATATIQSPTRCSSTSVLQSIVVDWRNQQAMLNRSVNP